jgi:hypothetical protein
MQQIKFEPAVKGRCSGMDAENVAVVVQSWKFWARIDGLHGAKIH